MNALKISTDGNISVVNMPRNGSSQLGFLRRCVDGHIERVESRYGDVYVNEEGLLNGLAINPIASDIAEMQLVGDVVITGKDCGSLSDANIAKIKKFVGSKAKGWTDERRK